MCTSNYPNFIFFQGNEASTSDLTEKGANAQDIAAVEDEDDRQAAKTILAEVGGDIKEFEEDENVDFAQELTPIEQYALQFVQRENRDRGIERDREAKERNNIKKTRELERKKNREMEKKAAPIPKPQRQRSERIDSKQKLEKAKENEKKRQRKKAESSDSEEEEVYVPKKRIASPRRPNGVTGRGRGRPRKEESMKVQSSHNLLLSFTVLVKERVFKVEYFRA